MMKLEITTHGGLTDILEVENYNPTEIMGKLEEQEPYHILIGDIIYSKIDIKNIKPVRVGDDV